MPWCLAGSFTAIQYAIGKAMTRQISVPTREIWRVLAKTVRKVGLNAST